MLFTNAGVVSNAGVPGAGNGANPARLSGPDTLNDPYVAAGK